MAFLWHFLPFIAIIVLKFDSLFRKTITYKSIAKISLTVLNESFFINYYSYQFSLDIITVAASVEIFHFLTIVYKEKARRLEIPSRDFEDRKQFISADFPQSCNWLKVIRL